jgi:hypothetical protein
LNDNVEEYITMGGEQSDDNRGEITTDECRLSQDVQVDNPGQNDDEAGLSSIQLKKIMEMMRHEFGNLQARIQSENVKLVEEVSCRPDTEREAVTPLSKGKQNGYSNFPCQKVSRTVTIPYEVKIIPDG